MTPLGRRVAVELARIVGESGKARRRLCLGDARVLLFLVVMTAWFVSALLVGWLRPPGWDEAVYLSQVRPDLLPFNYGPQRAPGLLLILGPAGLLQAPSEAVRIWVTIVNGIAILGAFWPWTKLVGRVAPLSIGLFFLSWPGLWFLTEYYPNFLAATASVGVTGCVLVALRTGARSALLGAGGWAALLVLLRPSDAAFVCAALGIVVLVRVGRSGIHPLGAAASGALVGLAVWVGESFARFGNPIDRLGAAAGRQVEPWSPLDAIAQYAFLIGAGAHRGPVETVWPAWQTVSGLAMVTILVSGTVAGLVMRPNVRTALLAATVVSVGIFMPYLVMSSAFNVRYLLPGILLAILPGSAGWARFFGRFPARTRAVAASVVLVVWVGVQATLLQTAESRSLNSTEMWVEQGQALSEEASQRPCAVALSGGAPVVQYVSGCRAKYVESGEELGKGLSWLAERRGEGYATFVIVSERELSGDTSHLENSRPPTTDDAVIKEVFTDEM